MHVVDWLSAIQLLLRSPPRKPSGETFTLSVNCRRNFQIIRAIAFMKSDARGRKVELKIPELSFLPSTHSLLLVG
jgi:hypothetical protein